MNNQEISYQTGLPDSYRDTAVALYDEAFGAKFAVAIPAKQARIALLKKSFVLDFAIGAIYQNTLVGIAGFQNSNGSLTGGITYREILKQLGFIKGNWAALIFTLYERKQAQGELLMDGIAVSSEARGKGIGSQLLREITNYAKKNQFSSVRLDVIDTNPKAKRLYEKFGFKPVTVASYPYLKWLLGFGGSTSMQLRV